MRILKRKAIALPTAILLILGIAFGVYSVARGQGKLNPYVINLEAGEHTRVLIATHQTRVKDVIMQEIKQYFKNRPVFISVIDALTLGNVRVEEWDGVVILSAIEFGRPPKEVSTFLTKNEGHKNIAVFLTVDSERWNTNLNVDATTSASKNMKSNGIIEFIDGISKIDGGS